eukprot:1983557-Pyramimonas_sp.AAC.1
MPGVSPESSPPLMILKLRSQPKLQEWRVGRFQHVAVALAPHRFVLVICSSFKDGERAVFKTCFSH